ncbi:MAG TPA: hypothetical protein VF540_13455 [Segetibacter sp.]|jgi:hypothetical protein
MKIIKLNTSLVLVVCIIFTASFSSYSQSQDLSGWEKTDLPWLTFYKPTYLVKTEYEGTDSAVWEYEGKNINLNIEVGLYAGKYDVDQEEKYYSKKSVEIDSKKAEIVTFKFRKASSKLEYIAILYFNEIGSENSKMSFTAYCKTAEEREIAKKIFYSIKFKNKVEDK